jgi:hypothetical protein
MGHQHRRRDLGERILPLLLCVDLGAVRWMRPEVGLRGLGQTFFKLFLKFDLR